MSSDGANLGVSAERALGTILGGDPQPEETERQSPADVRKRVLCAPKPHTRAAKDYSEAADAIALAILTLIEDGRVGVDHHDLYGAVNEQWPGYDEWLGGATGFMVGFAENTVRYILSEPARANPAIIGPSV